MYSGYGLVLSNIFKWDLVGYANAGYLSDPHNGQSQIGYLFTSGGTVISWRSVIQIITVTSSNHAEILTIHEASRKCIWFRFVIQRIHETYDLSSRKMISTILYEDNTACITQLKEGYIKRDRMKYISPKLFFTNDL